MKASQVVWICLLIAALAACKSKGEAADEAPTPKHEPKLSPELVPAAWQDVVLGETTEAELAEHFVDARRDADRSLGGDMSVRLNDTPAIMLRKGEAEVWLTKGPGDAVVVRRLTIPEDGVCERIGAVLEADSRALDCPGTNRVFGKGPRGWEYCIGSPTGDRNCWVSCEGDRITYELAGP